MTTATTDKTTTRDSAALPARPSPWRGEWKALAIGLLVFGAVFMLPMEWPRFTQSVDEAMALARWYAREHVLLCLVPAFFIAGAIGTFVSKASAMKWLGPQAPKVVAYCVASVSGSILAVCSCTVLPLFAGIRRMGAGLGPAVTFLYAGPAVNVLAIIMTARVLDMKLGIARAVGAIVFSIAIGLVMHLIYRNEESQQAAAALALPDEDPPRPLGQTLLYFAAMIGVLVFANWAKPADTGSFWHVVWSAKWMVTAAFAIALAVILVAWFGMQTWKMLAVGVATLLAWALTKWWLLPVAGDAMPAGDLPWAALVPFTVALVGFSLTLSVGRRSAETEEWFSQSWVFAKQIAPLLFAGVLVAGMLLGRPGEEGLIPSEWVTSWVGGDSVKANFIAAVFGAFMYFATLTEVPILEGLRGAGMGEGPSLALLLAGPAVSLPNMLVIRSVIGTQKTLVYVGLVIVAATSSGIIYGAIVG